MIYILRTLWVIGYPSVYLIESISFLVGIILYPFIEGYAYIKTGKGSNYHIGVFPEYISKKYEQLKTMTPQEFIKEHKAAVDYHNGKTDCMISISNAEKAVALAEYNLAQHLLTLHESARIETLERIVLNYQTKANENN